MKTTLNSKRAGLMAATLAVAAFGFAGAAQARDNVSFSVGIGVPGVHVGVTNHAYPVYRAPVYVQPAPVYVQPRPVYVPRPVYYGPQPIYYSAPPVYVRPGRHHGHRHGGYVQAPGPGYYAPGYAPVYYPR